jgi:hypothetical protein
LPVAVSQRRAVWSALPVRADVDTEFLAKFRTFFRWRWHPADRKAARRYATLAEPRITGFPDVALPQGLVASGFFANAFLLDFDEAIFNHIGQWQDGDRWQLN